MAAGKSGEKTTTTTTKKQATTTPWPFLPLGDRRESLKQGFPLLSSQLSGGTTHIRDSASPLVNPLYSGLPDTSRSAWLFPSEPLRPAGPQAQHRALSLPAALCQPTVCMCAFESLLWKLAHMTLDAKESHGVPPASG